MMKLLLLLAVAAPAMAQCSYTFSPPASQTITISSDASAAPNTITVTGFALCSWQATTNAPWITFPNAANNQIYGSGTGAVTWVASQNLTAGSRSGAIVIAAGGVNYVFTVVQTAPVCTLSLSPASVSVVVGGASGSIQVQTNCSWGVTGGSGLITLTSAISGTLNGTLSYTVPPNLCLAARSGVITIQAGGTTGPAQSFQVNQDGSPGNLTLTPATLTASASALSGKLAIATDSSCSWSAYSDVSWLSIAGSAAGSGNFSLPYQILANPSAQRTGNIHVSGQLFAVTQQAVAAPAVVLSAVLNGADYANGAVSPGEIVAVFGANIGPAAGAVYTVSGGFLPKTLGGVQLLFDGVAAPLLYASSSQVNAVVPYAVTGSTKVQLTYQSTPSPTLTLPVVAATPGILTLDRSGFGGGAILNQDLSTNTPANPAAAGSVVVIYCVGGGVTNPPSADGAILGVPAPVLAQQPVTVTIGGTNSQVLYSGAVAYSIAGLTQINAVVPPGLTAHGQVPVVVSIGGVQSQSGVTVALQ